jgi:hypothetical protein
LRGRFLSPAQPGVGILPESFLAADSEISQIDLVDLICARRQNHKS